MLKKIFFIILTFLISMPCFARSEKAIGKSIIIKIKPYVAQSVKTDLNNPSALRRIFPFLRSAGSFSMMKPGLVNSAQSPTKQLQIINGVPTMKTVSEVQQLYRLEASGIDSNFLDRCNKDPNVEYCESDGVAGSTGFPEDQDPNDPGYLYNLESKARLVYHNFSKEAWAKSMGEGILVGVIDSAFLLDHEDLQDNIWINPRELPVSVDVNKDGVISLTELKAAGLTDTNGDGVVELKDLYGSKFADNIDNDGNGQVDDFLGWDFYNNDNDVYRVNSYHATNVSGIIAMVGNNRKGGIGAAPRSKILSIEVGKDSRNDDGVNDSIFYEIDGINYAVANGAKVINYSRHVTLNGGAITNQSMNEEIKNAVDNGVVFVAAAGNLNKDAATAYPANNEEVITVGALNISGQKFPTSNYGSVVAVWTVADGLNLTTGSLAKSAYDFPKQTSIATPYVTGAVALLMSKNIKEVPDPASPRRIQAREYKNLVKQTCKVNQFGYCVLDALALVSVEPPVLGNVEDKTVEAKQVLEFEVSATDENNNLDSIVIEGALPQGAELKDTLDSKRKVFSWTPQVGQEGEYLIKFKAIDKMGLKDIKSVTVTVKSAQVVGNPKVEINSFNVRSGNGTGTKIYAGDPLIVTAGIANHGDGASTAGIMYLCSHTIEIDPDGMVRVYVAKCHEVDIPALNPGQVFNWTNNDWPINASSVARTTGYFTAAFYLTSPTAKSPAKQTSLASDPTANVVYTYYVYNQPSGIKPPADVKGSTVVKTPSPVSAVPAAVQPVGIQLQVQSKPATVVGQLTRTVSDAMVFLQSPSMASQTNIVRQAKVNPNNTFSFNNLVPGKHVINVYSQGRIIASKTFEIR